MFQGYLEYGGTEIANNNRTMAYLRNGLKWGPSVQVTAKNMCPALDQYNYLDPATDVAPWLDLNVPQSGLFAGLFIEDVVGLETIYSGRVTTSGIGRTGGVIGTGTIGIRNVAVTGWLFGKTCAAVNYGYNWLSSVLDGKASTVKTTDSGKVTLGFFSACPDGEDLASYRKQLHNVALTTGINVLDRYGSCCTDCGATALQVSFTVSSETPWIYGCSNQTHSDLKFFGEQPKNIDQEVFLCVASCNQEEFDLGLPIPQEYFCCEDTDVAELVPQGCRQFFDAPKPALPLGCYCEPLSLRRTCADIKNPYKATEYALNIHLYSGAKPLRNFRLAAYHKPEVANASSTGCPCQGNSDYWECDGKYYEVLIPFVPRNRTLVIDAVSERLRVVSPNGKELIGGPNIVQPGQGYGSRWLNIDPGADICVVGWADGNIEDPTAPDATMSVEAVERTLVCP